MKRKAVLAGMIVMASTLFAGAVGNPKSDANEDRYYSDKTIDAETMDCGGNDLHLNRIGGNWAGTFTHYMGGCDAPALNLEDISFDRKTNHIAFHVLDKQQHINWQFSGILLQDKVSGTLTQASDENSEDRITETIVLKREEKEL